MGRPEDKSSSGSLLDEVTRDPEAAKRLVEVLESYRSLAEDMGSAQPLIDALCGSFALMGNAQQRSDYDELRRVLVRYLQSVDTTELQVSSGADVAFHSSPNVSEGEVRELARQLTVASAKKK